MDKEIKKLPQLAAVVSELMSEEGLEVDGVKNTFKVAFGGKLSSVKWAVYFVKIFSR
jgi:hypothetical protein